MAKGLDALSNAYKNALNNDGEKKKENGLDALANSYRKALSTQKPMEYATSGRTARTPSPFVQKVTNATRMSAMDMAIDTVRNSVVGKRMGEWAKNAAETYTNHKQIKDWLKNTPEGQQYLADYNKSEEERQKAEEIKRRQDAITLAQDIDVASSLYEPPTKRELVKVKDTNMDNADMFSNDWEPVAGDEHEEWRTVQNERYNPLAREERDALIDSYYKAMMGGVDSETYHQIMVDVAKNGGIQQLVAEQKADAESDRNYSAKLNYGINLDDMSLLQRAGKTAGNLLSGTEKQWLGQQMAGIETMVTPPEAMSAKAQTETFQADRDKVRDAAWDYVSALVGRRLGGVNEQEVSAARNALNSTVMGDYYLADETYDPNLEMGDPRNAAWLRVADQLNAVADRIAEGDSSITKDNILDFIQGGNLSKQVEKAFNDDQFRAAYENLLRGGADDLELAKAYNPIAGGFGDMVIDAASSSLSSAQSVLLSRMLLGGAISGVSNLQTRVVDKLAKSGAAKFLVNGAGFVGNRIQDILGMAAFGTGAYGASANEARQKMLEQGIDIGLEEARKIKQYAAANTGIELGSEMMFSSIGAIKNASGSSIFNGFADEFERAFSGFLSTPQGAAAMRSLGRMLGGGIEEGLEEVVGDLVRDVCNVGGLVGDENKTTFEEYVKDFLVGAMSGLMGETSRIVTSPMQQSKLGRQLREGSLDISLNELADLANSEGMENTTLAKAYSDIFHGLPRNIESISDLEAGKLYEAYEEMLGSRSEAINHIEKMQAKLDAGKRLTRSDVNRITNNNDAVAILSENGTVSEDAFKGGINERRDAVEMALRSFANDSTALSEADADNVQAGTENANTAVSAPNPFLMMSQDRLNDVLRTAQPANSVEAIRNEAQAREMSAIVNPAVRVINSLGEMGVSEKAQEAFLQMYSPQENGSPEEYSGYMSTYYKQGLENQELDENNVKGVSLIQAQLAWREGRIARLESTAKGAEYNGGTEGKAVLLRDGTERMDGQDSVGSYAAVGEISEGSQIGQAGFQQRSESPAGVHKGARLTERQLNAKDMAAAGYDIVTDSNDREVRAVRNEISNRAKRYGIKVRETVLFRGEANINGANERGFFIYNPDGSVTIGVQIDATHATARQILIHELTHALIKKASVDLKGDALGDLWESGEKSFGTIRDYMAKKLGGQDKLMDAVSAYAAIYKKAGVIKADKYGNFRKEDLRMVFEEMICDFVAGMNAFAEVGHFGQAVRSANVVEAAKTSVDLLGENITRGSPSATEINNGYTARAMEETVDNPVKASISIADAVAERSVAAVPKNNETLQAAVQKAHDDIRNILIPIVKPLMGKMDKNGMPLVPEESSFSPNIFSNGSYGFDAEPTTECYRQMGYRALAKMVTDKLGRPLTNIEAIIVNQAAVEIAIDPPCLYCYSLLDRKAKEAYKIQYLNERDSFEQMFERDYGKDRKALLKDIDKQLNPDINSGSYYSIYLNNGKGTRTDNKDKRARVRLWMEMWANNVKGVTLLDVRNMEAEEATAKHINGIENKTVRNYKKESLKDVQKWVQAASQAKKYIPYSAYTNAGKGNLLSWKKNRIDLLNSEYGLRWYSHADFHPAFAIDNMQQVIDASVLGLKGLMYCKPIAAAKIMAPTGMNINVSCFAQFKDGKYISDDKLGANWDEVKALRKQYKNVGSVMVVTSDDMLLWALSQDWVDVVIPLHRVRSGSEFIQEFGLSDYTGQQADKADKAKFDEFMAAYAAEHQLTDRQAASAGKKMKSVYPAEHQNDYDTYLKICQERGLTPRFEKIRSEILTGNYSYDGVKLTPAMYMKLVNETRQSESQTQPLQPVFDMDAAKEAVESLKTQGYFEYFKDSSEWNGKRMTLNDWADQAAKDIEAGKKPSELGYGRDLAVNEKGQYIVSSRQAKAEGLSGIHKASAVLNKEYETAVREGNMTEAQKLVDQAAKAAGYTRKVYHGTLSGGFTVFDKSYSHTGGNSGAGFYTSTTKADSEGNYADVEGADNFFKARNLAYAIANAIDDGVWEGPELNTPEERLEYAKKQLTKNPQTYTLYGNPGKTYIRDGRRSTNLWRDLEEGFEEPDRSDYDNDDDYDDDWRTYYDEHVYGKLYGIVRDAYSALEDQYEIVDAPDLDKLVQEIAEMGFADESLVYKDIEKAVERSGEFTVYFESAEDTDDAYSDAEQELVRAIIEAFGYDSITDKEVSWKFNQVSRLAENMEDKTEHVIFFRSNQMKLADTVTYDNAGEMIPLSERFNPKNDDIRFSRNLDSAGNKLSAQQAEYFKDSKVRDENGNLLVMYHGTDADFNIFDFQRGGEHGKAEGFGIYLADDRSVSEHYGGRIIESYANITRPARSDSKTIKSSELAKLIKASCLDEAKKMAEEYGGNIADALRDTWVSNYVYTYDKSMDAVYREVANNILRLNDNDMDIVQEVMAGMAIRTYDAAMAFYNDILTPTTGIDGFITHWSEQDSENKHLIALAFNSNQVKNTDNQKPTKNPDIRFSRDLAPTFYSKLEREIEAFKGDKIGAASAIQYLKGKGVKDEDIKWSGITTFLEGKKSVGKAELLEYLRDNRLQIKEEILDGSDSNIYTGDGGEVDVSHWFTDDDLEFSSIEEFERVARQIAADDGYDVDDVEVYEDGDNIVARNKKTGDEFFEAWHPDPYDLADANMKPATATRWEKYSLRGGSNYREILYRIPNSDYENSAMRTHWGRNGIVAHARVQDYKSDERPVLFVDEIQSDWHNEGAKSGYGEEDEIRKKERIKKERRAANDAYDEALKNATSVMQKLVYNPAGYDFSDFEATERTRDDVKYFSYATKEEATEWLRGIYEKEGISKEAIVKATDALYEAHKKAEERQSVLARTNAEAHQHPVKDAPFKNNYTDFVLKDLLRKAAEGNYDYLAWTPGWMQEERWSKKYAKGYQIEYDQDIPAFLKKYGKQWGANVSRISLDHHYGFQVPAIEITDAMKQSVLYEGQPMFSRDLSNTELYEANRQLQKDLTELRSKLKTRTEQRDYWRRQTQKTEDVRLKQDVIKNIAKEVIKTNNSKADQKAVAEKLNELGNILLQTDNENWYDDARMKCYEIAHMVNESAEVLDQRGGEHFYKDFRDALKQAPIYVAPSVREEVAPDGWNDFRKAQFGTVNMTADQNKGKSVDTVYHDLQATFGEWLLPEYVTSEADQLNKILEVVETYRPIYENMNSYEMAEANEWVANEILTRTMELMEIGELRQEDPTRADIARERINAEKQKSAEALKQVRQQRDLKVADLKAHYQQVAEDRRNRKIDSEMRSRLLAVAKRLNNKKLPRAQRALLDQYIGELDLVSKGLTGRTIRDLEYLRDFYEAYKKRIGNDFTPDPFIQGKIDRLYKKHISDMTQEEVADLTTVLLSLEKELWNENRLINSEIRQDLYAAGMQTIDDIDNSNGKDDFFSKYIGAETASPERYIHRITGYRENSPLYQAVKELSAGQRKMLDYQRRAEALFKKWTTDRKFIRRIAGKHAEEITISGKVNGEMTDVKITPAMRIALYLHGQNDDNMRHIAQGGVTIPDITLYKQGKLEKAYEKGVEVILTRSQLLEIVSHMSDEERAFANAISKYYNGMSRDSINDVSEDLKGYAIAGVEYYYPIDTNKAFLAKEFDSLKRDGTLEGMGFLKDRQANAATPIMLYDANDTLNRSIQQHSRYYGLAIPVRNLNRLYGVTTFRDKELTEQSNAAFESTWEFNSSVQKAIQRNWGNTATKYIGKMLTDIQNGTGLDSDAWGDLLAKARSKYAGAVLTTNASVAMKQAASYPTAAAVVGYGPLMRALADVKKIDLDKLAQYTPLLWYRSKGFSTTELGDIGKEGGHIPKALNWIQAMDVATTTKLAKAAMYYVNENNNLTRGTDAWWKAVAEVYNRIIEETQPNYTMMQRPQILRSDNALTRALNMFKTQPFQNFNILYDAFGNLAAKSREYKANASAENLQALKSARTNVARAVSSQAVSAFVFALMQFAWDAFRGKAKKYKDDDDEMTLASWLKGMGINVLSSAGGMIPFGSYVLELGETMTDAILKAFNLDPFFDQTFYGLSENASSSVNDMGKAMINMVTKISQTLSGGEVTESTVRSVVDSMGDIAQFAGIPVNNVIKLAQSIGRNIYLAAEGRYVGGYHALRLTTDPARYSSDYYDLLWKAYNNDKAAYDEVLQLMLDDGFEEDKIKSAMEKRMKDAQGVSSVKDLESRWMAPSQQKTYDEGLADLEKTTMFQAATDEQQKALLTKLYNLALDNDAGKKLNEKIAGGADVGLEQNEYLLYTLALSMVDEPTESGKYGSYTNDEVEAAILMVPGLSKDERAYLWTAAGKTDKSNPFK